MTWASIAAKNKDVPAPRTEPQIVRAAAAPTQEEKEEEETVPQVAAVSNAPKRRILVLDTGALIKGSSGLTERADEFVTIQDVLAEVRDRKTKEFVESFPFEIQVRDPSKAGMKAVLETATKTGDVGTLSPVDLRLLALAYTVALENDSIVKPAVQPVGKHPPVNTAKPGTEKNASIPSLPGWGSWDDPKEEEEKEEEKGEEGEGNGKEGGFSAEGDEEEVEGATEVDGGWITPENIKTYKSGADIFGDDKDSRNVGCMTTDFAMQNVLLHTGLQVVSVEGYRVKYLKKWVLRCHACYTVVKDTTKQFCPSCGSGDTLKRVSYSVNDKGEEEIWINPKRRINIRGTIHNLPKPRGGRSGTNKSYVIREDMLRNCGKQSRGAEDKRADYLASLLSDDWMFAGESRDRRGPQHVRPTASSYSKKNVNHGRKRKV